jgi:hypothetical protein
MPASRRCVRALIIARRSLYVEAAIQEALEFLLSRGDLVSDAVIRRVSERLRAMMWPGMRAVPLGRSRPTTSSRDIQILQAVLLALRHERFKPTRNRDKHDQEGGESACAIVAVALRRLGKPMTESAVEKIWQRRWSLRIEPMRLVSYDSEPS